MLVFQITINGKPYCEDGDIAAVTLVAEPVHRRGGERVSIHARSAENDAVQWLGAHLAAGDEIVIRILEAVGHEDTALPGCSFCGRELHDVQRLIQGRGVGICEGCVAAFSASVRSGAQLPLGASLRDEAGWACSHCARQPPEIPGVVVRGGAAICPECLRACSDML